MYLVLTHRLDSDLHLTSALYLTKDRGQITERNTTERTYLFDESIGIIRAADGVHEGSDLLNIPQPWVLSAVTALI